MLMKTVLLHDNYGINTAGHFTVAGIDTVGLAKEYGTPLYVFDEDKMRSMCEKYTESAARYFKKAKILFASKALSFKEIYRIADSEGLCADTVSSGEIYTALAAGFPPEKIHFHGNNKTVADLEYAVKSGVGVIIADNLAELDDLDEICAAESKTASVVLRVTPGIDPHTHVKISTGKVDSKFGSAIETGQALEAVKYALAKKHIRLIGIHCHVGSQSFDPQPFLDAADIMMRFLAEIREKTGATLSVLNLGGGFGVKYKEADAAVPYEDYMSDVSEAVHAACKEYGIQVPYIYIEPGRSIVCEAGLTLYTVGDIKTIPNVRTYVAIDGGMYENPRYALYQSDYTCLIANKANEPADFTATIAGKCCESGDLIQENTLIQKPEVGDILAVLSTGAYNYSMASNYNRNTRPPVVMVRGGESRVIIKGETYDDLVRNDV